MLYDKDIREPLFMYFEEKYGKTRVFEEKRMGNSRADILIITEKDCDEAFEIIKASVEALSK